MDPQGYPSTQAAGAAEAAVVARNCAAITVCNTTHCAVLPSPAGTIEHANFMMPWQHLPETIYARALVKPGDKVGGSVPHDSASMLRSGRALLHHCIYYIVAGSTPCRITLGQAVTEALLFLTRGKCFSLHSSWPAALWTG